jgi:hypothetical protein
MKVLLATAAVLICSCAATADSFDNANPTPTTSAAPQLTDHKTVNSGVSRYTTANSLKEFAKNESRTLGGFNRTTTHSGLATVTVGNSFAAAEPGTLALLGVGLVGFLLRKPKKPAISANWEPLA